MASHACRCPVSSRDLTVRLSTRSASDRTRSLLVRDPEERPGVEEVLQHPFCMDVVQETARAHRSSTLRRDDFEKALEALDDDD